VLCHVSLQRLFGHFRRELPSCLVASLTHRTITSEAELAPGCAVGTFEHDGADRAWKSRMTHSVKHNLCNGPLPSDRL
jgi:hypothetical protein